MPAERDDRRLRELDLPARLDGLRWREDVAAAREELDALLDLRGRVVEVHVAPAQREDLALAHPGRDRQDVEGLEALASGHIEEGARSALRSASSSRGVARAAARRA